MFESGQPRSHTYHVEFCDSIKASTYFVHLTKRLPCYFDEIVDIIDIKDSYVYDIVEHYMTHFPVAI